MRKVLVYPFSKEVINLIKVVKEQRSSDEFILSIPRGWQYVQDDSMIDASGYSWGEEVGCFMTNGYDEYLENIDEVVILDSSDRGYLGNEYLNKITSALNHKKNVSCYAILDKEKQDHLLKIAYENQAIITFCDGENFEADLNKRLQILETPIAGFGNLISDENKNNEVASVAHQLKELGYKPTIVTQSKNMLLLEDIDVYVMKEYESYDVNSILEINQIIKTIEIKKRPDIILVTIPGTMMKFSNEIYNDFSLGAYCFSQALDFDYFVMNSLIGKYPKEFYKSISECFEQKYGFNLDTICIENKNLDVSESIETHHTVLNKLPYMVVDQYLEEIGVSKEKMNFLNGCLKETYIQIAKDIASKLSSETVVA